LVLVSFLPFFFSLVLSPLTLASPHPPPFVSTGFGSLLLSCFGWFSHPLFWSALSPQVLAGFVSAGFVYFSPHFFSLVWSPLALVGFPPFFWLAFSPLALVSFLPPSFC